MVTIRVISFIIFLFPLIPYARMIVLRNIGAKKKVVKLWLQKLLINKPEAINKSNFLLVSVYKLKNPADKSNNTNANKVVNCPKI